MFNFSSNPELLGNKALMLTAREELFEFIDLSDELLKKYGLKHKLEAEAGLSNNTFWHISRRKEHPLPDSFFLNQFWMKLFNVAYYTFDLLDNEHAPANFAYMEECYGRLSERSLDFYLTMLYGWISDSHRSCERYSTLLNTEKWKHIKEVPTFMEIYENLSGSDKSGNGASGEA